MISFIVKTQNFYTSRVTLVTSSARHIVPCLRLRGFSHMTPMCSPSVPRPSCAAPGRGPNQTLLEAREGPQQRPDPRGPEPASRAAGSLLRSNAVMLLWTLSRLTRLCSAVLQLQTGNPLVPTAALLAEAADALQGRTQRLHGRVLQRRKHTGGFGAPLQRLLQSQD